MIEAQEAGGGRPRVIIAEDFVLIQESIRILLEPFCEVVALVEDGLTAIKAAVANKPDILLVDVSLPGASGFAVAEKLHLLEPEVRIIFVTAHADRNYVKRAFEIGARAYVLKGSIRTELPAAINEVMRGALYRSPVIAG